jgi:hypothetical protein
MNLEEMLRQERDDIAPNPLLHRTDHIITRVRRRRRTRAVATGVVSFAVVAVMAIGARQLLPHQTAITPAGKPTPSHTAPPEQAVRLWELPQSSQLDPGRYVLAVDSEDGSSPPQVPVLSVPNGFEGIEGGRGVRTGDLERYVWVWETQWINSHPCKADSGIETVGLSVADLANALTGQPLRSHAAPIPVQVGGYDGLYLELSVPNDIDISACPDQQFRLWPGRWQEHPGQVDMVWIVDVEGQRIIFDASHEPTASPAEVAELKDMVTSASFAAREGP